jgi:hypothetical protein
MSKLSLDTALYEAVNDERLAAQHGIPQDRESFIKTLRDYGWEIVPVTSGGKNVRDGQGG